MDEVTHAAFTRYLSDQSRDTFLELRELFSNSSTYKPYGSGLSTLISIVQSENYKEAKTLLSSIFSEMFLNPGVHNLASFVLSKLGSDDAAQFEHMLAFSLLRSILETGDGSKESPYLVLHVADEYDILAYLEKKPNQQRLERSGDKYFDIHECQDGSEIWFDVTKPREHLGGVFEDGK
jgi:hypothetical protein